MSNHVYENQSTTPPVEALDRRDTDRRRGVRIALVVALVGFVAWDLAFTILRPELVGDEHHHVPAIEAAARGDWKPAWELPMPPTYHWLAVWATRAVGPELWALRAFQTFWTLLAILLYHAAAKAYHSDYAGRDLLRFGWHPLLFAFGALVCTDLAALVAILIALNLHVRRRYVWAALALVAATVVRQSSVLWAGYFLIWALAEEWLRESPVTIGRNEHHRDSDDTEKKSDDRSRRIAPGTRPTTASRSEASADENDSLAQYLRHLLTLCAALVSFFHRWLRTAALTKLRSGAWTYLAVFLIGSVVVAFAGRGVLLAQAESNAPDFNPAVFYLFVIAAALLWLPIWLARLAEFLPRRFVPASMRIWRVALVVALIGVVAIEFRNPHPWNMDPEFPHNWPLYAMVMFGWARALLATVIVIFVITYALDAARSPARRMLALTWGFTLAFLLPHNLADLRYYIVPFMLIDFLTPRGPTEGRVLAAWHLILSLAIAGLLAFQLGGVKGML